MANVLLEWLDQAYNVDLRLYYAIKSEGEREAEPAFRRSSG